jgi:A/G-specific adenine glycosylase
MRAPGAQVDARAGSGEDRAGPIDDRRVPEPRAVPAGAPVPVGDAADFGTRVVHWQRRHGRRDLPWQGTRDAYRIWLSEVMLQQTQVTTVLPYYARFLEAFPDVRALAAAPVERVLERWSGLGYYRRAHHLHAAAQRVVAQHDGVFPTDAKTLATLPGIGRSTAAAIAAFSSGERGAILDGNVKRVLARHAGIEGFPGAPRVAAALWDVAQRCLPAADIDAAPQHAASAGIEAYTQGMMDLGATVCVRTRPRCDVCPVASDCVARVTGRIAELPSPRPRKVLPQREIRVLVLERDGSILLERRPATGIWGGLWSLPEVALDDDLSACLRTRYGIDGVAGSDLPPVRHGFTHFGLMMHPRRIRVTASSGAAMEPTGHAWWPRDSVHDAALPSPIRRLLRDL